MSLEIAPKIQDSQIQKRHDFTFFSFKNERAQDGKSQKSREDKKNKRSKENKRGKRIKGGYYRNKVNPVVRKSSGSKASVYYHIIYWYYQGLRILE